MADVNVNIKGQVFDVPEQKFLTGGTFACSGCGPILGTKLALKALGKNTIMVNPAGCMTLTATWPFTPYNVPWVHSAIENCASTASGILMGLKSQKLDKNVNVLCFAGDGATYDIGFQALSGMAYRKEKIIYVCYNNSSFANTGFQRTAATPKGARTKTSEPGKCCPWGNALPRKNMSKMLAMSHCDYVATACVAFPKDFMDKLKKAASVEGPSFIDLLCPCIPGWLIKESDTIEVGKAMVETGIWPLYEILHKKFSLTHKPKMDPVQNALSMQGRFKHLKPEHVKEIQKVVNKEWDMINSGKFWESDEY
ncbi:pyruvate synthase subunit beta [Candidatus Woesearchaeota archaeon]|nr:pyruvate synthase subunit beta [Candidatus Woesearchaeota archaeon]MBW3021645.1 pyruvate synthase subunit beta [Candidatus Woesearchaeota archaeon]